MPRSCVGIVAASCSRFLTPRLSSDQAWQSLKLSPVARASGELGESSKGREETGGQEDEGDETMGSPQSDMSWGMFGANAIGVLVVARIATTAGSSGISLLAFGVVLGIFATVITGIFYIFRRKTEERSLKRSFVIALWVFLVLVVIGEHS